MVELRQHILPVEIERESLDPFVRPMEEPETVGGGVAEKIAAPLKGPQEK